MPFPSSPGPLYQNEVKCSACDMKMTFPHANKTHFHKKGCALRLILKVKILGTPKWPIIWKEFSCTKKATAKNFVHKRGLVVKFARLTLTRIRAIVWLGFHCKFPRSFCPFWVYAWDWVGVVSNCTMGLFSGHGFWPIFSRYIVMANKQAAASRNNRVVILQLNTRPCNPGRFPFKSKFRTFRLVHQMERTISVWSDRNFRDQLWRWSTLTGLVISVGQTEMSLSVWQNFCPQAVPLFCILLSRTITKRAVAWVGSVQPECTVPLSTRSFRNFKPGFLLNGKPTNQPTFPNSSSTSNGRPRTPMCMCYLHIVI